MSNVSNNHSSMNIDSSAPFQPGSKRKASDNNSNGNSGLATANTVNSSVRQKISNESNHNSNSTKTSQEAQRKNGRNILTDNLNDTIQSFYSAEIHATSIESYSKKMAYRFFGEEKSLLSDINKKISDLELLDGDGCALVQLRDDHDCVTSEPLHVHFKVERGCVGKFEGKIPLAERIATTIEAKLALVNDRLIAIGKGAILTMSDGVVIKGDLDPSINRSINRIFVNGEGAYQGEMPPKKVILFAKKIVNIKVVEKVAYLPSGELVVGIQYIPKSTWIGKKENSPADDGKVTDHKLEGNWVKIKKEGGALRAWDGRFENDVMVNGTIYLPEGGSIKVEQSK